MLLPFYPVETGTWRDFAALISALGFVVFLFWHLNLHYMNIVFAICGYRVFTILPPKEENPISGRISLVLITPRTSVLSGERIVAYRLSDTVYFEAGPGMPAQFDLKAVELTEFGVGHSMKTKARALCPFLQNLTFKQHCERW